MTKKKKNIIIIVILVVLGATFFILRGKEALVTQPVDEETEITKEIEETKEDGEKSEEELSLTAKEKKEEQDLSLKARNFIERVYSFSSDSQGLNLKELKSAMTAQLFAKLTADLIQELAANKNGFYGQTSKVISSPKMTEFNPGRAHFKTSIQIEQTKGEIKAVSYQTVEITFLKINNNWQAAEIAIY